MIKEHDTVVLVAAVPAGKGFCLAMWVRLFMCTVMARLTRLSSFPCEGKAAAVITLEASQVRPVWQREIAHARKLVSR